MGSRKLACVASVSVRFRSKERGTRVKDCAKDGASKRAGRGWGRKFPSVPSLSPLFHFLALVSFLRRPKLVFLCSETKRKRLLRRLHVKVNRVLITFSKWSGGGSELSLPFFGWGGGGEGALSDITLTKPHFSAPLLINIAQSLITICLPNSLLASPSWRKNVALKFFISTIFFTSIGQCIGSKQ